jgi:hypothetical protein
MVLCLLCDVIHMCCSQLHLFDIDIPGKITFKESLTLTPGEGLTVIDSEASKPQRFCVCRLKLWHPVLLPAALGGEQGLSCSLQASWHRYGLGLCQLRLPFSSVPVLAAGVAASERALRCCSVLSCCPIQAGWAARHWHMLRHPLPGASHAVCCTRGAADCVPR